MGGSVGRALRAKPATPTATVKASDTAPPRRVPTAAVTPTATVSPATPTKPAAMAG
jgi:hypothetical protein